MVCLVSDSTSSGPKPKEIKREAPYVEVVVAESKSMPATIESHGVVQTHIRRPLIAEVPGIVEGVAPFQKRNKLRLFGRRIF